MASKQHVVVIGAGVIGLQTSLSLLKAGFEVTILANHFPGDSSIEYTSPWAGDQWRSHASEQDQKQREWDLAALKTWFEIIEQEGQVQSSEKCGLLAIESVEYFSTPETPWYAEHMRNFSELSKEELPSGYAYGCKYISVAIDELVYLEYLLSTCKTNGAVTIKETLPTSSTSRRGNVAAFVNATDFSARTFVPDENVFPIRGQTVIVKGVPQRITTLHFPTENRHTVEPDITYIIPRAVSGGTVLGDTNQNGNWESEPNPETTKKIIENAKVFAPELLNENGEFEILNLRFGLRSGMQGGASLEVLKFEELVVCYAYGNAEASYQNSIGFAEKIVKSLQSSIGVRLAYRTK